ncbi:alpha- and gamma-adaptin-binding protein p34 isoform X1 [Cephus cinctus]|uniref:Alpha- and gamma-adaptin-binding protein p34 isoform X1 n=1 Tax=Cephus cinctus TaxID=211228 RepID=A0AAJ7RCI8_CEPCN|nr:alpha- and gamma-adaptin-binding protein p34 isoform X1 [Cephus cinctus]
MDIETILPRVLIASTVKDKAADIVKSLGSEQLVGQSDTDNYIWNIDNKYYTAQILLCTTENPWTNISLYEGIEALIIYHDPQAEQAAQLLDDWMPLINSISEAEILLFVCNALPDGAIKDQVVEWCTLHKFELVEFGSVDAKEVADQEDENEKHGIDRIIEALHAHAWPNMALKGPYFYYSYTKKYHCHIVMKIVFTDQNPITEKASSDVNNVGEQLGNIRLANADTLHMDSILDGIMGAENTDFGELFGQLMAMKEHAASLPANERRIAAEQLVTAFWKAMGGDPSEIEESD